MKPILPPAALQQHIAILGKTGAGKTTAAKSAIVEPLLAEGGKRVAIIDPTSAWYGLRTSRDGKGPGFPILVLGGDHGDLPLPALGGAAVARLIAEQNVNLIADTSLLTVGERTRWFIDFATTLYRLNRAPLCLVIDEAHMFMPQGKVPDPDTGKMLHAGNTLASGGRSRGIRLVMLTQRPQKLHKDALTSADTLIALRVLAPQDRSAIEDWIKGCGDPKTGAVVLNSLAQLQRGEGWIWYPEGAVLDRVTFPPIRTFDSSATPTDGAKAAHPKAVAEIDLTEIKAALADAVKEAEQNDPKRLRAEIARLERELKAAKDQAPVAVDPEAFGREYQRGKGDGYALCLASLHARAGPVLTHAKALFEQVDRLDAAVRDFGSWLAERNAAGNETARPAALAAAHRAAPPDRAQTHALPDRASPARSTRVAGGESSSDLSGPEQRILDAIAWMESIGVPEPLQTAVAFLAGYSGPDNGAYKNPRASLNTKGLVRYLPDRIALTEAGGRLAHAPDTPASIDELQRRILDKLPGPERKLLAELIRVYPEDLSNDELAQRVGYSDGNNGAFKNPRSRLRTLGLIDYPTPGRVVALPVLFLEG